MVLHILVQTGCPMPGAGVFLWQHPWNAYHAIASVATHWPMVQVSVCMTMPTDKMVFVVLKMVKTKYFSLILSFHFPHFRNRDYANVPYSGYYKFLSPAINLHDADLIKDVLIKDHFSFHINEQQFDEKNDPLMVLNPFGAKDDIWRKARTVLTPLLTLFKVNLCGIWKPPFYRYLE